MSVQPPSIPLAYFEGFLDVLAAHAGTIEVITYADLAWGRGDSRKDNYRAEWQRWQQLRDPSKIYVLLQHDVDNIPERTMRALQLELERGIRSNVMIFARKHDRQRLQNEGVVELIPYGLDIAELQRLEREQGFVIGYHVNAYEQALWDARKTQRRFREDVRLLRKDFDIRFYSAHGGVRGPNDTNNRSFEPSWWSGRGLRWVCTGHNARMTAGYSDGAMFGASSDLASRDLRDFVRTWQPGGRYRVLTHPQYYGEDAVVHPRFADVGWYARLFGQSAAEQWAGVSPAA